MILIRTQERIHSQGVTNMGAPLVCPVCSSDDMSRKDIFEDTDLTIVYVCHEGHEWRESWEFKSYEVV